jgi:replicative DNA helicase
VIDNSSRQTFQSCRPELFTEQELRHYEFVRQFLTRYGGMPAYPVMVENNLQLPAAAGPVEYHLQRLADRAVYRAYADNQPAINAAFAANDIATARQRLATINDAIRAVDATEQVFDLTDSLHQAWVQYQEARDHPGELLGMSYGWDYLDELTGGLRPGDVGTIVARPGLGKSFTIVKAMVNAWRQGASIAFVSMEMTAVETARRIISMEVGVNPDFLQRGRMSQWGEGLVENYMERMAGRPPFRMLVGDLSKSISDVDAMIQEHGPDYVGIDASYLLKPTTNGIYRGKRFEAMAEVGEAVKGLALRRNKPILQTVQFNRSAAPDEEMDLSQIGGTDVVGQVSALVLGMRRGPAPFERSRRRYLLLKNRHGPDHVDFLTRFEFNPFNMDIVEDEPEGVDEDGNWDGTIGTPPAATEWTGA